MFHYKDGIYFGREENGDVIVEIRESAIKNAPLVKTLNIDADGWCSIIASVSDTGETSEKWQESLKFHGNSNFEP